MSCASAQRMDGEEQGANLGKALIGVSFDYSENELERIDPHHGWL